MKKLILVICLLITSHLSLGAGDIQLLKAPVNLEDKKSLQRGARNFVNYCLNCHSASYMRYNQLQLIGLSEETIKKDLLFTSDKIGNPMSISMDAVDAKKMVWGTTTKSDCYREIQRRRLDIQLP